MAWFGDLGIITGRWPLISTTRSFNRHEWSVPGFRSIDPVYPAKGWLIEYNTQSNKMEMIRRTYRDALELTGLPQDGVYGYQAIENILTELINQTESKTK